MGFRLKVKGKNNTIKLGKDNIEDVKYHSDTPDDSDARATDFSTSLTIKGKIITAIDGEPDDTKKVADWSILSAEKADAYRKAELETIAGGQVIRKVTFPNAFVVDYIENFGKKEGTGKFTLVIRQKKDKCELTKIEGGYSAGE